MPSRLVNRNCYINASGIRTSMRLEPELWEALEDICRRENTNIDNIVSKAEKAYPDGGRTSAVRVFIIDFYKNHLIAAEREYVG